jgi:hypothetical protein
MKSSPLRDAAPAILTSFAVAAAGGLGLYFVPDGWPAVWRFVAWGVAESVEWLAAPAQIPTAVLLIMGACTIATLIVPALLIYASRSAQPGLVLPTQDEVSGIVWRWSPSSYGRFDRLTSFCPKCDYEVYPRDAAPFAYLHETSYLCEKCKWKSQVFDVTPEEVEDRVRRELQRKAREWLRKIEGK